MTPRAGPSFNRAALLTLSASLLALPCLCSGQDERAMRGTEGTIDQPIGVAHGVEDSIDSMGGGGLDADDSAAPYDWDLPPGFPTPWEPVDNPTTEAKVLFGRHLFMMRD